MRSSTDQLPRSRPQPNVAHKPRTAGVHVNPFTVIVDTRESAPFGFHHTLHNSGSRHGYKPLMIPIVRRGLLTGDYSIEGFEKQIVCERKSLADLFGSLAGAGGERRERFAAEHERMQEIVLWGGFACVVIEASRADARNNPPGHGAHPNAVLSASIRWPRRYGVPWVWAGTRTEAELFCFEWLADCWRKLTEEKEEVETEE